LRFLLGNLQPSPNPLARFKWALGGERKATWRGEEGRERKEREREG